MAEASPFLPAHFERMDDSPDDQFYVSPRFVTHIDDDAIATIRRFYGETLPPHGAVLDLMSSWVSHLPNPNTYASITGLGMNEEELRGNPQLGDWVVQDLNANPVLPIADETYDGAIVTVSVQYLTRPVEVFAEVGRVLKPGAPFIVSYSNRCFPTKAVAVWRTIGPQGHARLIELYLEAAGFTGVEVHRLRDGRGGDPMTVVMGRTAS